MFVGTHDFTQFSNKPFEPGANGNPVKRVVRCDVVGLPDGFRVEVHASGFLYRQVPRPCSTLSRALMYSLMLSLKGEATHHPI